MNRVIASLFLSVLWLSGVQAESAWEGSVESYFYHTTDVSLFSATRRLSHDQDPTLPVIETEFANRENDFVYEPEIELTGISIPGSAMANWGSSPKGSFFWTIPNSTIPSSAYISSTTSPSPAN